MSLGGWEPWGFGGFRGWDVGGVGGVGLGGLEGPGEPEGSWTCRLNWAGSFILIGMWTGRYAGKVYIYIYIIFSCILIYYFYIR